jgi:hypothetical protein
MVGNGATEVKPGHHSAQVVVAYTSIGSASRTGKQDRQAGPNEGARKTTMVEVRIKPHLQQVAEDEQRAEQRRLYRRNQVWGLLIVAAAIVVFWLFHTNRAWIFPPGWWRP